MVLRIVRLIALLALVQFLAACNSQVTDFIKGAEPLQNTPVVTGTMGLKISPGKMQAASTDTSIQATVTTTNRAFSVGSDMAAQLNINLNRVSPQ